MYGEPDNIGSWRRSAAEAPTQRKRGEEAGCCGREGKEKSRDTEGNVLLEKKEEVGWWRQRLAMGERKRRERGNDGKGSRERYTTGREDADRPQGG